jgi:UDP-N-acetylglucosamine:LPS N-acetylglucosamine transferase
MRTIALWALAFSISIAASFALQALSHKETEKKKIKIAWSKGGGAHKSMRDALTSYLKDDYEVTAFNPFEEVWAPFDHVRKITFKRFDGESLYNFLLAHDLTWIINRLYGFGLATFRRHSKRIEKRVEEYLSKEKPDLLISVIPVFNYALNQAAARLKIPFLVVAPDFDISKYFLQKDPYPGFYCTLPFSDPLITVRAAKAGVGFDHIQCYGFPLRLDFFTEKSKESIKTRFKIPSGKPIVMILMGAAGSSKVVQHLRRISQMELPLHVMVCIGNNEKIRKNIKKVKLPDHISLSIIGFTKQISDLMAIADVLISKSGPTSLCEAFQMRVPLLIDAVSTTLEWEKAHIEFVKKYQLGEVLTSYRRLKGTLTRMLSDKEHLHGMSQRMSRFSNHEFPLKIKSCIAQLVSGG